LPLERQPIAIFSKHLQWLDYDDAAEAAAAAGFDALDIPVRPRGHVLPERAEEDLPRAVDAARKAGLSVPMITTAITSADDPHAESVLRTAAGLGIRDYRMGYVPFDGGVRSTLDATRSRWRDLAVLNESLGIRAGYQNHSGTNLGAAIWDLLFVLEEVDSPWIGCQFDIRHAVVEGAFSWVRDLEVIAPFIHTLVAKDFVWAQTDDGWRVENVPLGDGIVPLAEYVRELRRLEVSVPFSMHFEYPHLEKGRRRWAIDSYGRDLGALRSALGPRPEIAS
jgi:sugar phosphate isomerase/epimerase